MMVLFQNKIIYMPSVPPFSRGEGIAQYASSCMPVVWEEATIRSLDNTRLALCIGSTAKSHARSSIHVVALYFQGLVID